MIHEGHRERLKKRFVAEGIDGFEPHNVLELLLFFGIPYRDTNEISHALLEEFGSFSGVLDAPYEELVKVKGVGENTATLLKLIPSMARLYGQCADAAPCFITCSEDAGRLLLPKFIGVQEELVLLVCLDNKRRVLNTSLICKGTVNATQINLRIIVSTLLKFNATMAVLAHNHPGGFALPSQDDLESTRIIRQMLKSMNIDLLDHLIVADSDFVSLRESGYFK